MYNLDDKNLDRLSREASENFREPGTPSWENMEKTLDKVMPQEKKKRRGFILWFILLGLLAGGSFYYFARQQNNPVNNSLATAPNTATESPVGKNEAGKPGSVSKSNTVADKTKEDKNQLSKSASPVTSKNTVAANPNHTSNAVSNKKIADKEIVSNKNNSSKKTVHLPVNKNVQSVVAGHQPLQSVASKNNRLSHDKLNTTAKGKTSPLFQVPPVQSSIAAGKKQHGKKQPANKPPGL
jgi:cytoskeletal protein RodZ